MLKDVCSSSLCKYNVITIMHNTSDLCFVSRQAVRAGGEEGYVYKLRISVNIILIS